MLTACGTESDPSGLRSGEEQTGDAATDGPVEYGTEPAHVSADFGSDAGLTFPDSGPLEGLQVEVLQEGDGVEVAAGAAVLANYAGHVWGSEEAFDSSFVREGPSLFSLNLVVQGWSEGIPGHRVGSRLLISIPPEYGYGTEQGNPGAGIGPQDTIVFVVDLIDVANPQDAADPDATPEADLDDLTVMIDGELGGPAQVTVRDGAEAPGEPLVEVIARGDGHVLAPGDTVAAAFSFVAWDNSERDTTWPQLGGSQPFPEVQRVGAGYWQDLLDGVPVGSRVLITFAGQEQGTGVALLADVLLSQAG